LDSPADIIPLISAGDMNDNSPTPSTDDWQRPYRKTSQVYRKGDALIQDIVAGRITLCLSYGCQARENEAAVKKY
jgi:hypothetical protein